MSIKQLPILLLEDNLAVGKVLSNLLVTLGATEVELVRNIDDAISEIGSQKYGLCVLDVAIGDTTSVEACKLANREDMSVILISGLPSRFTYAANKPHTVFLQKPIRLQALREAIALTEDRAQC